MEGGSILILPARAAFRRIDQLGPHKTGARIGEDMVWRREKVVDVVIGGDDSEAVVPAPALRGTPEIKSG